MHFKNFVWSVIVSWDVYYDICSGENCWLSLELAKLQIAGPVLKKY